MGLTTDAVPGLSDYSADAGLPFDAAGLERRIVWMWGSPRSGSTWLLRQLAHPLVPDPEATTIFDVPAPDAPDAVWARPFDVLPVDESFISNHLSPAFADPREVDGVYVPGTINNYLGKRPVYAYSDAYREVWAPEARRFALVRLFGFLARARDEGVPLTPDPLLVIKEVNGSHAADLIMGLMPRSRLLFLVRDGRDVVDSLLHAYQPGGFLARHQGRAFETPEERAEGLRWAALLWSCNVDMTLRAIDAHPPELTHIGSLRGSARRHGGADRRALRLARGRARRRGAAEDARRDGLRGRPGPTPGDPGTQPGRAPGPVAAESERRRAAALHARSWVRG